MEIITLKWHGPYQLDYLQNHEIAHLNGIYAIYRVWGDTESLLYIGKTDRGFVKRLNEHYKGWLNEVHGQIYARCGIPYFEDGRRFSKKKISDVEMLLISWHMPPENTISRTYYYGRDKLTVVNVGRRGSLYPQVSTDDYE